MLISLFEDNHLLVLHKPAGLLTQPSGTEQDSLEGQAKAWLKKRDQKPGYVFLEAVHRLDKQVSGIVLFGKTSKALSRLNESIRQKNTRKTYWAWIENYLPEKEGRLEHYLIHDNFKAYVVDSKHLQGKFACLSYKEIKRRENKSLLEIHLETGRYHQIRVQMAAMGCPIIGDAKYGSSCTFQGEGIALHHYMLEIPHPISKVIQQFKDPIPTSFI